MGWNWHWLDHIQTICTLLQAEKDINTSSLNFYGQMLFLTPKQQCQSIEGNSVSWNMQLKQVCVQPHPLAVNTTLPAFADERRAAVACHCRSIFLAHMALSSKPWWWWDRQMDTRPFYRPCSAYYAGSFHHHWQLRLQLCSTFNMEYTPSRNS